MTMENLNGKSVVITGTFWIERKELVQELKKIGVIVMSSISKNTDYLLVGEKLGNSKLSKAEQLDIPKISEQQLINYLKKI